MAQAELPADSVSPEDVAEMSAAAAEIVAATGRLLDRIHAGELAKPVAALSGMARTGWL